MNEIERTRGQSESRSYRTEQSLNGTWEFALDPDDEGRDDGWFGPDADWPERTTVDVPHAWQERDEYLDYAGVAWYRRRVEIPEIGTDERVALSFGAVDYEATVWVDGDEVGSHRGGYLPFEFDITDESRAGEVTVVVRVEDPEDIAEIPHGKQGAPWYTRVSGIWGDVALRTRPGTRTTTARVTPNLDTDTAAVELTFEVGDESRDLTAVVTAAADGETVAEATADVGSTARVELDLDIENPTYWTPETPHLYDFTVRLRADGETVDRYEDYFGMRSFETTGSGFLLNGEPLRLRGALDQGYYPRTLYRPFEEDLFEREIRIAKKLGFNMLRKHIKPAHPDFVEAADRLGILVWEEPANPSVYTERSKREVREQLKALVERDYNSPSVVVWSLYNEEWGIGHHGDEENLWTDGEKQAYLADLYETVREWDPTRPICDNSGWAHVATDVNDYHRYFVSPDRADAWADDLDHVLTHPADNYGATETDPSETPLVISEFGTWGLCDVDALRERYGGDPPWFDHDFFDDPIKRPAGVDERYERSHLSTVFDGYEDLATVWQEREFVSVADVIGQMRARDDVAGYVITEFSDIEWEFNGLLDYHREEKAFCDEFAAVNGPAMVRLEPHVRSAWSGEDVPVDVVVVNDTPDPIEADLAWEAFDRSGTVAVAADPASVTRIDEAFSVVAPAVDGVVSDVLTASLETSAEEVTSSERLWAVESESDDDERVAAFVRGAISPHVAAADNGITAQHDLDEEVDVAIVTELDESVRAFAEDGGAVLLVPDSDGSMTDEGPFEFRELPATESWNLVSSLFYSDSELVADLVTDRRLGWAFDDLYPYAVATNLEESDEVYVGYVEGWLANEATPLVTRAFGEGTITACTFRLTDAYGEHPTATTLMSEVLEEIVRE